MSVILSNPSIVENDSDLTIAIPPMRGQLLYSGHERTTHISCTCTSTTGMISIAQSNGSDEFVVTVFAAVRLSLSNPVRQYYHMLTVCSSDQNFLCYETVLSLYIMYT